MSFLREWAHRLAGTFRRGRSDSDLREELRVHAEMAAESAARAGEPAEAAARAAAIRHGRVTQALEAQRDQRGLPWIADLGGDARYALRGFVRNPAFSGVVILSLAIGIGANTALFSLINALMLRSLPVRAPEQLVYLLSHYPGEPRNPGLSWRDYEQFRDQNHVFSDFVGTSIGRDANFEVIAAGSGPETVRGEYVVGAFFPALGIRPAIGRLISDEDDRLGAADVNVAVISWSYWQRHFDRDPSVLGRQITVNGVSASIVGVTPRAFTGLVSELKTDVWVPTAMSPSRRTGGLGLVVIGRLKPGVSIEQARAEVAVFNQSRIEAIARRSGDSKWLQATMDVEPAGAGISMLRDSVSRPLFALIAGAGVLLLLACTNIASLLLARGASRQREIALRVSLGAGRFRLVRQVLTESLLLATAGSAIGLYLAHFGAGGLVRVFGAIAGQESLQVDVTPDRMVLFFTLAIGLGTGLLFGLVPAWQAFSLAPASSLREGRGAGETTSRRLVGKSLVVAQVALSAMLLSTGGLFAQHLSNLRNVGLGFDRDSVLLVSLDPRGSRLSAAQLTGRYRDLLDRFGAIPGVRSVTLSRVTPMTGGGPLRAGWQRLGRVEGFQEGPDHRQYLSLNAVAPGYFETLGTPVLAGREFAFQDAGRPRVAIVNQAMARRYFADRSPLGQHVSFDDDSHAYEIVGVVADAKVDLHDAVPATVYLHAFQDGQIGSQFILRTDVAPLSVAGPVRRAVQDVVNSVSVQKVATLAEQMDESLVLERTIATLSGLFGALGVMLAAMGLFGLLAYTVARRTNEIGVRMVLGATERDVMRMVLKGALAMVAVGLALGAPAAFWSTRLAAAMVENLPVASPFPIAFALLTLTAVALVTAYVPARRAARVRPVEALRHE
jgi:predicted permease